MSGNSGFLSPARSPDHSENPDDEDQISSRAKDMFEPKNTSKCVRFLTVMAYILSVSMAAILLSLYYVFLWNPQPHHVNTTTPSSQDVATTEKRDMCREPVQCGTTHRSRMSHKSNLTNSVRSSGSYRQNSIHEKLHSTPSTEEKIKFAGDDSKDRLYEPKQNKKMVRVLTVVVYVFSVSLAAIMLSLYYVFFWKPQDPTYLDHAMDRADTESVNLRDNVTNKTSALPRCLEKHDRVNPRIEETVTFPFQRDDAFTENNTTEEETSSNIAYASTLNDSDIIAPVIKKNTSILINILEKKDENLPNNT